MLRQTTLQCDNMQTLQTDNSQHAMGIWNSNMSKVVVDHTQLGGLGHKQCSQLNRHRIYPLQNVGLTGPK